MGSEENKIIVRTFLQIQWDQKKISSWSIKNETYLEESSLSRLAHTENLKYIIKAVSATNEYNIKL